MQELIKKLEEYYKKPISELDNVDWKHISEYQILPEYFIREFHHKVNWEWIENSQKLSEKFIRKFKEKGEEKTIKSKNKWYQFWKWFKKK